MDDVYKESDDEEMSIVKELLLCPVCFNYMFAPIRQCRTGHSFCDQCFSKIKRCPECRATKSEARSFKLEAISSRLMFPCKNKHLGCDHRERGESINVHEKFCRFGLIACPFKKYDTCDWHGYLHTLQAHCLKKHNNNFYCKQKQKFLAKNFLTITNHHYIYVLIHTFGEFFRLTWELENTTGVTKWSVMYMGSSENAKKFSYKLEFLQCAHEEFSDVSRDLTWMSPCGIFPEDENEKFLGHNYVMIHRDVLNLQCDPKGDLNYSVQIFKSIYCDGESESDDQHSETDEELNATRVKKIAKYPQSD